MQTRSTGQDQRGKSPDHEESVSGRNGALSPPKWAHRGSRHPLRSKNVLPIDKRPSICVRPNVRPYTHRKAWFSRSSTANSSMADSVILFGIISFPCDASYLLIKIRDVIFILNDPILRKLLFGFELCLKCRNTAFFLQNGVFR